MHRQSPILGLVFLVIVGLMAVGTYEVLTDSIFFYRWFWDLNSTQLGRIVVGINFIGALFLLLILISVSQTVNRITVWIAGHRGFSWVLVFVSPRNTVKIVLSADPRLIEAGLWYLDLHVTNNGSSGLFISQCRVTDRRPHSPTVAHLFNTPYTLPWTGCLEEAKSLEHGQTATVRIGTVRKTDQQDVIILDFSHASYYGATVPNIWFHDEVPAKARNIWILAFQFFQTGVGQAPTYRFELIQNNESISMTQLFGDSRFN